MKINIDYFTFKFKEWNILMRLESIDDVLISSNFVNDFKNEEVTTSSFLQGVKLQLAEYFLGTRKQFDIPLKIQGTENQISVYRKLQNVEYGRLKTYNDLAREINNPNASRFIGSTMNKNNLPIIIPCHRIIPSNLKKPEYYGNYAFFGPNFKKDLICFEKGN